jgi:hypothetical protein
MQGKIFKLKVLIIVLISFLFLASDIAYACKCNQTIFTKEHFANAVFVFEGRIDSVWPKLILKSNYIYESGTLVQSYKFRIFRKWKGEIKDDSIVLFGTNSDCDSYFIVGETYLVYAIRDTAINNRLTSSQCSGTDESSEAIEDFKFLGPGEVVSDPTVKFVPENKFRRILRHSFLYLLAGVWITKNIPAFIKANDNRDPIPYSLLLLHLLLFIILSISSHIFFRKKIPKFIIFSFICLLFSIFGTFFLNHSVFIGFSLNLLFLFIFSIYYFLKTKSILAIYWLLVSISFSFFGLLVFGYFFLNDLFLPMFLQRLLA